MSTTTLTNYSSEHISQTAFTEKEYNHGNHLAVSNGDTEKVIISITAKVILHWIVWAILSQAVVVFGIFSNIINIVCFVKQGFKDSINVSLTALAISDLGCLLPLIWTNLCYTPSFGDLDWPFEVHEFGYMTTGITHVALTRISSWIMATITLERCLCVAMPLKVKEIVTPKRTFIIITSICVVLLAGAAPQYYFYRAGRKYYPDRNKTLIGIMYSQDLLDFEKISYPINFVFLQFLAFVIILFCTAILVIELNIKTKWRTKSSTSEKSAKLSSSNTKVAKMVVMCSVLFICSFTIIIANCIAINSVPGFTIDGELRHLLTVIGGFGFLSEAINASMNIFIYYRMSSKYREVLNETIFLNACGIRKKESSSAAEK